MLLLLGSSVFLWAFKNNQKALHDQVLPRDKKLKKVVIDAGHGGHDSGCHGSSAYEKHVALAVSLKLGKLIEQYFPDVEVVYTRKTDVFVELHRRAQIANENQADLFICIHCNSGPKTAYGAETFVMGLHKTDDNLNVARRENAVILQEDNYEKKYDGFDPNSPEAHIIFSLYQNAYLFQSLFFAEKLQQQFKQNAKRHDRGVKQAGFLVLYRTTMPAVLIETGFLTNNDEEHYLKSAEGQNQMAHSILNAFQQYKAWVEGTSDKRNLAPPAETEKQEEAPKAEKTNTEHRNEKNENSGATVFRVQIHSSPAELNINDPVFKGVKEIWSYEQDKLFKYTVGKLDKVEDAIKLQAEMKTLGFKDAFVVAFRNNKRIPMSEITENK
ncbi:MAG: N-acetylmuramoyl-L-alanine amidase [Bacteroidia bacterium]